MKSEERSQGVWPMEDENPKVEEEARADNKGREIGSGGGPQAKGLGRGWRGRKRRGG